MSKGKKRKGDHHHHTSESNKKLITELKALKVVEKEVKVESKVEETTEEGEVIVTNTTAREKFCMMFGPDMKLTYTLNPLDADDSTKIRSIIPCVSV